MFRSLVLLAGLVPALCGCGEGTLTPITAKSVNDIRTCRTTKRELIERFGEPTKKSQSAVGQAYEWYDDDNKLYVVFDGDFVVDWVRNPIGTYMATNRCKR